MSESRLTLRAMTRAEWDEWMPRQMAGYAEHIAASGAMSEADAWEKAMLLAEGEARSHGMTSLGLNVHGQNKVARSLYDSLGYDVMAQQMKKPL
jgi:hypothetical protein